MDHEDFNQRIRRSQKFWRQRKYLWTAWVLLWCGLFGMSMIAHSQVQQTFSTDQQRIKPVLHAADEQAEISYAIQVRWHENKQQLIGSQQITWHHPGTVALDAVYLHLYPNAFASSRTTFMRESDGQLRNDKFDDGTYGHISLGRLIDEQGRDLLPRLSFIQPDDGNPHDHTLAKIRLAEPLHPGEHLTLELSFTVQMPSLFARMGVHERFVMAGQWYPKLAAYELANAREREHEGWNLHQYHGNSEFFADFASYDVQIAVPEDLIVAATGHATSEVRVHEGWHIHHYTAHNVHDFAWAASPDFQLIQKKMTHAHLPSTDIHIYLDPQHSHLQERYLHAATRALAVFSDWYGPYPYCKLSVVVPPSGAGGAGGMEYPMLVTAWAADEPDPGWTLERVLVHEIGHQFWYGLVANNEFEEAWLDESLTSFAEDRAMEEIYGLANEHARQTVSVGNPAPLNWDAWAYQNARHYAENVYLRGKLVLADIEHQIGETQMREVFQNYFAKWRFAHPGTSDFRRALEEVTGESWRSYFAQFVERGGRVDFELAAIDVWTSQQGAKTVYRSNVTVRRLGAKVPVEIEVMYGDGESEVVQWDGRGPHHTFTFRRTAPVIWAEIDPQHLLLLEHRRLDNVLVAQLETKTVNRWRLISSSVVRWVIRLVVG